MRKPHVLVTNVSELLAATQERTNLAICVSGAIDKVPEVVLHPGVSLYGQDASASIRFLHGSDGLRLTRDNRVEGLELVADDDRRVICNDTGLDSLGTLKLKTLVVRGQVSLFAREAVRSGHVVVQGLDIRSADCRRYDERPKGFGVAVVQGAFTLWNQNPDAGAIITADLVGLSAGRPGAPVIGSGIFVCGFSQKAANLHVSQLVTGAVYSTAQIAAGVPDVISGGVFTVYGAQVGIVHNLGEVITYGQNDMVLDNWGIVDSWTAEEAITSYGPSGIGFVNFGVLNDLVVKAPIQTFGQGSRGFNVYDGTLHRARFDRIVTHADGAVGIQVSKEIGSLIVERGIETFGGVGQSLVKGVIMTLAATPLSIKPGGVAKSIRVSGGVISHGDGVQPIEVNGTIGTLEIEGELLAAGSGFTVL